MLAKIRIERPESEMRDYQSKYWKIYLNGEDISHYVNRINVYADVGSVTIVTLEFPCLLEFGTYATNNKGMPVLSDIQVE